MHFVLFVAIRFILAMKISEEPVKCLDPYRLISCVREHESLRGSGRRCCSRGAQRAPEWGACARMGGVRPNGGACARMGVADLLSFVFSGRTQCAPTRINECARRFSLRSSCHVAPVTRRSPTTELKIGFPFESKTLPVIVPAGRGAGAPAARPVTSIRTSKALLLMQTSSRATTRLGNCSAIAQHADSAGFKLRRV